MSRFELKKLDGGDRFALTKNLGLDNIRVELTWQKGDLDAQAWLLNIDGTIVNDEGFVFYNSANRTEAFDRAKFGNKKNYLEKTRPMSADGAVLGAKDELTGGIETINICLSKIAPEVQEVAISATVYVPNDDDVETFGEVENARITVFDEESGDALCFYELSKDYKSEDALVAARFVINDDGEWEFEAVGNGYNGGLQTLVDMYTEE
ncbi:MAG: TerD family protein [Muribaculaceae bacterium]|nr:TerD family protein [Muribaculaceae bacterium]